MQQEKNPILRVLNIPDALKQFMILEKNTTNTDCHKVLIRYALLGIRTGKDLKIVRDFSKENNFITVAIPSDIEDIVTGKTLEFDTHYNNVLVEYIILGIKSIEKITEKDKNKTMWIQELDKFISTLKMV